MRLSLVVGAAFPLLGVFSVGCSHATDPHAVVSPDGAVVAAPHPSASAVASAKAQPPPSKPVPPAPPSNVNVVLLSVDSMRADMPWAGYERPIAPRLTELAKRSVMYTHGYSVSSYTSMSLGGLLAGRIPSKLQRDGNFFGTYRKDVFFPKLLQNEGVHTIGVQAHSYLKNAGFEQGFDVWKLPPNITFDNLTDRNITSPDSERMMEEALSDPKCDTGRFFAWAHFMDPHDQYLPHPGIGPYGKSRRDLYDAEVTYTDQYIGKLLDFIAARPWASRTVIIVTSDHGEAFGEHGQYVHGFELWENLVHVPLFVVAPGATPRTIDEPRSALDLAPTILQFFGVQPDAQFEGHSLVSELYGATPPPRDVIVDLPATSDNDSRRALIAGRKKVICSGSATPYCRLYDLDADPKEDVQVMRGDDYTALMSRFRAYGKTVKEVIPWACGPTCWNGGWKKKANEGSP